MGRVTDLPPSFVQSIPGSPVSVDATFSGLLAQNYKTVPIPYTTAGAEQNYPLPVGVKRFTLFSRKNGILTVNIDEVTTTNNKKIPPGAEWSESSLDPAVTHTLYFSCDKASDTLDLTYWT